MADIPVLLSKEQINGNLIDAIRSRLRKDIDLNDGSVFTQITEAISQGLFKSSADIITMIDALNANRATGEALQRQANDANVPIYSAFSSYGQVSIIDQSFTKISTNVYAGQPAPVSGSLVIYVPDATLFPSGGGQIYVGRGTTNVEGPLTYTSVATVAGGAYWAITLAGTSPTTKFHNIGETVVLAQGGNRFIPSNTTVQTAQGASILAVSFSTTAGATIPDGEVQVDGVPVICQTPGTIGNVSIGAISEIVGVAFTATVNNPLAFTNGVDADTDQDIQDRIQAYEIAKSKGTDQAIETAVKGLVALDELKKVSSANVITNADNTASLVFSDGQAYEPNFLGAPFETVVDSAVGGEINLQLRQVPVAQARIENTFTGPYAITAGSFLSCIVEGVQTTHQFLASDFLVPSSATAQEIAASINGDINIGWSASTANNGANVVVYPTNVSLNQIAVVVAPSGVDANVALGFPLNPDVTIRLFKNDLPLYEDGVVASINSREQATWASSIATGNTLIYQVDNTPPVTATFTTAAFQAVQQGAIVSASTSLTIWAAVCNSLMPGVITTVNGNVLTFASARGANTAAAISFIGGTLLSQIFDLEAPLEATGTTSDYTLNKWTGQIGLAVSLQPGDKITAGSQYTRGNDLTSPMPDGPGVAGRAWIITDGAAESVPNGLSPNTSITFSKTGTILTISGLTPSLQPQGFDDVSVGDWLIVWANPTDPAPLQSNQGFWRVLSVTTGVVTVDDGPINRMNLNTSIIPTSTRIVFVKSAAPVQLLSFDINPLTTFLGEVQSQLTGTISDIEGSSVRISTATFDSDGQFYVAAVDMNGSVLGLTVGEAFANTPAFYGFVSETDAEAGIPNFTWSALGTAVSDNIFDQPDFEALGSSTSDFLEILERFTSSPLAIVPETNKTNRSLVTFYDPATTYMTLDVPLYMQTGQAVMNATDRFFMRSSYKFYSDDQSTVIVDGNASTESYALPISRQLIVSSYSTPSNQDFSATDNQSSLALSSVSSFYDFDFSNFKIHRQAQATLTNGTYSILVKSADYGPSGNTIRVGLFYPPNVNQTSISSNFGISDVIDAQIYLPVTTVRTPNWDFTTSFTVSVGAPVGGAQTLTYTWEAGTQPNFGSGIGGASVGVGDVVFLSSTGYFLPQNQGFQAKVVAVTNTSFTVTVPLGAYTSDAISFSNILNQNNVVSVTTPSAHGLVSGQRIGFYGTASPDGGATYPFNTTYVVTVTGTNTFTVPTPNSVPDSLIASASLVSNIVTVTTQTNHGLQVGDVVLISGAGLSYNGLAAISAVTASNQFQYVRSGSAASVAIGRVDFQSYLPTAPVSIAIVTASGTLITVNTSSLHGLNPGDITTVAGISISAYASGTTYGVGDIVSYLGNNYISTQTANTGNTPNTSPTWWTITTLNLSGTFVVNSTPTTSQFTYYYQASIGTNTAGTGGTSTELIPSGSMARAIGGSTNENLQFGVVSTTAQQVVDYISQNIPTLLVAAVNNATPNAPITSSTQDNGLSSNYYTATVTSFQTFLTSRRAKVQLSIAAPAGSTITLSGMSTMGGNNYNGTYVVIDTYLDTGLGYMVSVIQLPALASASTVYTPGGTATGSLPMLMLYDGENEVLSSNLQAPATFPMFTAKNAWTSVPTVGEQLRLVATTNEQLVRFWNELVVTGFSNVGEVELTRYGREIQLSTQTFGGSGSVQITGGTANSLEVALVGSGEEPTTKEGYFSVPSALHKGFVVGQWVNLINNITQNKQLGFSETTTVQLNATTLQITGGTGSFQTKRAVNYTAATQLKIEKHGAFVAVVGVGGPSMDLLTNGVQEGDWVRLYDTQETPWVSTTTYASGARVYYGGSNYTSIQNSNTNNEPDTSPSFWQVQEFNASNTGVFQVVRIFGNDTFWIVNANPVEEIVTLGNVANMSFYSYDSVMPGDVLIVTTNVLGTANIGRYTVVDNTFGVGYSFPTSTAIWLTPTITNPSSPVTLGGEFSLVNVQEANPLSLWKRILAMGPGNGNTTNIIVDSPNLTERITSSLSAQAIATSKLNMNTNINLGIDAYKYYIGLIQLITNTIYGVPYDRINFPGWRASGSPINIVPATLLSIKASFAIRIASGVPFTDIIDVVQSAIAGYVNNLDVGESVSISAMIAAASTIPGVTSVTVTSPTFSSSSDLIAVNANEQAYVINPTTDITITLLT